MGLTKDGKVECTIDGVAFGFYGREGCSPFPRGCSAVSHSWEALTSFNIFPSPYAECRPRQVSVHFQGCLMHKAPSERSRDFLQVQPHTTFGAAKISGCFIDQMAHVLHTCFLQWGRSIFELPLVGCDSPRMAVCRSQAELLRRQRQCISPEPIVSIVDSNCLMSKTKTAVNRGLAAKLQTRA